MKNPSNPKERNLLKGAIRRVFARSELRRLVIQAQRVMHSDPNRPRVKNWAYCANCGIIDAMSYLEVDHKQPIVPIETTLEQMSWDEVVNNTWCGVQGLWGICKSCHNTKTKEENKRRRENKNGR